MALKRSSSTPHGLQMLSSKVHNRHPTWPPTLQLLPADDAQPHTAPSYTSLPEIAEDEDPFSHFLSPVLEEEASTEESEYTAGIIPFNASPPLRRDALFRARLEEKWETYVARRLLQTSRRAPPPPLPLPMPPPAANDIPDLSDDDQERAATPDSGPASPAREDWFFPSTPDAEYDSDSDDGWAADRRRGLRIAPVKRKGRRAGRRRSWQEPGPELWPVLEEEEGKEEGRGRAGRGRKTVRWCEEVTVLEYEA